MARQPDPVQRLDFLYDFEKTEFILRFDNRFQAVTYQTANNEARILEDHPCDARLPLPPGMTSLRSSSVGMAVIFPTMAAAEKWQRRNCLGSIATFSEGDAAVYFKREWALGEMEEKLGFKRSSTKALPSSTSGPKSQPISGRFEVNVGSQQRSRFTGAR
ncbi:hypothetical protein J3F83DRAFT_727122 [Trichoderma novae-zelandiae]